MESFFGTLKTELVHQREYPDRDTARRDLFAYIEGYYNRQRIHSAIGYITPEQAEAISASPGVRVSGGRPRALGSATADRNSRAMSGLFLCSNGGPGTRPYAPGKSPRAGARFRELLVSNAFHSVDHPRASVSGAASAADCPLATRCRARATTRSTSVCCVYG